MGDAKTRRLQIGDRVKTMSDGEDTMMIDGDEDIVITSKSKGKGKATDKTTSDDNLPW
jgi:hypothetical protein